MKIKILQTYVHRIQIKRDRRQSSEFAICPVVLHRYADSIQNPSSVTNPTIGLYCILPFTLPCAVQCDKSQIVFFYLI